MALSFFFFLKKYSRRPLCGSCCTHAFTCFTSKKKGQILTQILALPAADASPQHAVAETWSTQFTCFTGTKVQIMALPAADASPQHAVAETWSTQFTCFPGTKVQILTKFQILAADANTQHAVATRGVLTKLAALVSSSSNAANPLFQAGVSLYSYKSTNTD